MDIPWSLVGWSPCGLNTLFLRLAILFTIFWVSVLTSGKQKNTILKMQENLILVGDNPIRCTGADGYTSSREIFLLQFASILYAATKSMVDGFLPARRSLFLMAQNGHFSKNIVFQ